MDVLGNSVDVVDDEIEDLEEALFVPEEPEWSSYYSERYEKHLARKKWKSVIAEIEDVGGRMSEHVADQVEQLVHQFVLFKRSMRELSKGVVTVPSAGNLRPQYSPWFVVMQKASSAVDVCEKKLGITQEKAKSSDAAPRKSRNPRPADAYLSRPHRLKGQKSAKGSSASRR